MGAASTPTSSAQRYTLCASIKRPFPAARLFTTPTARATPSSSPSSNLDKPVATTTDDVETPISVALTKAVTEVEKEIGPAKSTLEIENPPPDPAPPSKKRRSAVPKEPGVQKATDPHIVNFFLSEYILILLAG